MFSTHFSVVQGHTNSRKKNWKEGGGERKGGKGKTKTPLRFLIAPSPCESSLAEYQEAERMKGGGGGGGEGKKRKVRPYPSLSRIP